MQEERKLHYIVSERCTVCNAKDKSGNPLRDLLDTKKDQGASSNVLVKDLDLEGVTISQENLDRHFRKHSPWLVVKKRQLRKAKVLNQLNLDKVSHRNAEEEIQTLIDIGAKRIEDGELLVDKELYMFALNKKTASTTPMSIQNLVMNFGDALVDQMLSPKKLEKIKEIPSESS